MFAAGTMLASTLFAGGTTNGIGAEPAHIYDPSYPLLDKHLDIYRHWQTIYRISTLQARQGFKSMGFVEGLKNLQTYFNNKKKLAQG